MIKKLTLKNFQSHKDSEFEFHPGVNTLIGTSSHGKSAVIRGLILGIRNDPAGTEFVSDWIISDKGNPKGNTEVHIHTDEGVVSRIRGRDNKYLVDEKELSAFRTSVPEQVRELLQITDLNIQEQKDSFFLFNVSGGEVVKQINKFMNLDMIDTTLTSAKSSLMANKRLSQISSASLEETAEKLKDYEVVDTLSSLLTDAEARQSDIAESKRKSTETTKLVERYKEVSVSLERYKEVDRVARRLERANIVGEEIKEESRSLVKIENLVEAYKSKKAQIPDLPDERTLNKLIRQEQEISGLREKIKNLRNLTDAYSVTRDMKNGLIVADIDFNKFTEQAKTIEEDRRKCGVLQDIVDDYFILKKKLSQLEAVLDKNEQEYKRLMPDVCPLCGNECGEGCK